MCGPRSRSPYSVKDGIVFMVRDGKIHIEMFCK